MNSEELIPYMALETDGNWETIEQGRAEISGEYIVEEEPDEDRPGGVTRRLIFLQNQNFIQTEIKMMEKKSGKNIKAKKGAKDKKKDKKIKNDDEDNMDIDYGYFDDHHRAVLSGFVLYPGIISMCSKVVHKHTPTPTSTSIGM
jgi:hypothetical protein